MPVHLILGLMEIRFVFTKNYGKGYFVCAETKVVGAQWSKPNSRTLSRKWFPGTLILLYIVAVVFSTYGSQSSQAKRGIQKFTFSNWSHFLLYVLFTLSHNWTHSLASLLSRVCFHVTDGPYLHCKCCKIVQRRTEWNFWTKTLWREYDSNLLSL